jgi:hypothetical protein
MYDCLDEVKTKVEQIVGDLLRDVPSTDLDQLGLALVMPNHSCLVMFVFSWVSSDIRIGLIAHGDYYDCDKLLEDGTPSYVIRHLDFSSNLQTLCSFIHDTRETWGGGDGGTHLLSSLFAVLPAAKLLRKTTLVLTHRTLCCQASVMSLPCGKAVSCRGVRAARKHLW